MSYTTGWIGKSLGCTLMAALLLGSRLLSQSIDKKTVMAENILRWQRSNGGWPKDAYDILYDDMNTQKAEVARVPKKVLIDYSKVATSTQISLAAASKEFKDATIDNDHTVKEIRLLLQAFKQTNNPDYFNAAKRGIDYLFTAQYDNGGWPMFYPDHRSYKGCITFNDNAMVNVLNLMLDISLQIKDTDVFDKDYRKKALISFDRGISNILKLQLSVNGKPAVWCAQYNEITLEPAKARSYELPSLSGSESVGIVDLLMRIQNPSLPVRQAIDNAVDWFNATKIEGYRVEKVKDSIQPSGSEIVLRPDKNAVLWGRFYDLQSNKPFFCDRDGEKKYSLFEIGNERRTGYSWYGSWALQLINSKYNIWKSHNAPR